MWLSKGPSPIHTQHTALSTLGHGTHVQRSHYKPDPAPNEMNNKRPKSTTLTWMWGRCICLRCRSLHWGRTVVRCGTRWVTITITIHGCPTWARSWKWILGIGWPCQSSNMIQFSYHKQSSTLLIQLHWCNWIKDGCLRNTCSIPSIGKMFFLSVTKSSLALHPTQL